MYTLGMLPGDDYTSIYACICMYTLGMLPGDDYTVYMHVHACIYMYWVCYQVTTIQYMICVCLESVKHQHHSKMFIILLCYINSLKIMCTHVLLTVIHHLHST